MVLGSTAMRALEEAARVRLRPPEGTSRDAVLTGTPDRVQSSDGTGEYCSARASQGIVLKVHPQPVCSTLDSVGTGVL